MYLWIVPSVLVCPLLSTPSPSGRVLVIQNSNSPTSHRIATDYVRRRGVQNLLTVKCRDSAVSAENETITYAEFKESIEEPVRIYLKAHAGLDFIVLTKGVPIRVDGANRIGLFGKRPSVDSYLAALDYDRIPAAKKIGISDSGFTGWCWVNRFWNSKEPFTHARFGGYLVTRLDGYTADDAIALTTRSIASEKSRPAGTILLDACPSFGFGDSSSQPIPPLAAAMDDKGTTVVNELDFKHYNADMARANEILAAAHIPARLDREEAFVKGTALMGYCSWGSNDSHFDSTNYHALTFAPGGICETAVSTSARTFLTTSGGQSLIADLIGQGATGCKGYCDEPLLQAVASPSILFDRFTRGWTLAESFYAASRYVGWEDIVIGDPICRPYR